MLFTAASQSPPKCGARRGILSNSILCCIKKLSTDLSPTVHDGSWIVSLVRCRLPRSDYPLILCGLFATKQRAMPITTRNSVTIGPAKSRAGILKWFRHSSSFVLLISLPTFGMVLRFQIDCI